MVHNEILIATTNQAKLFEFKRYLDLPGIAYKTLAHFPDLLPVREDKNSFEGNAVQKALHYATLTKLPTLASDGGLCIDALGGAPGIKSRRWSGTWTSDEELVKMVCKNLQGVPAKHRTARLEVCIVCAVPTGKYYSSHSFISGIISDTVGPYEPGFPYRGLLLVEPYKKYYSALTAEEHLQVNHWRKALKELKPNILSLLPNEDSQVFVE